MSFAPLAAKDRQGRGLYAESQSPSDCCVVSRETTVTPLCLNMQSHILFSMQSNSREANGTPRLINMQSRSREATGTVTPFDKYAVTVAKRLLPHFVKYAEPSEATVMPRRRGVAASYYYFCVL